MFRTKESEMDFIQMRKDCLSEIAIQHKILSKADQFPDVAILEPAQMKIKILNYNNKTMKINERVEMLKYKTELLIEEKKILNRDYSKLSSVEVNKINFSLL